MYYCYFDTPIGELLLAGEADALSMIGFPQGVMRRDPEPDWIYNEEPFEAARVQLTEYFSGTRKVFDLPLTLGGTEFQVSVLEALQDIPYGETTSCFVCERRGCLMRMSSVEQPPHRWRQAAIPGHGGRRTPVIGLFICLGRRMMEWSVLDWTWDFRRELKMPWRSGTTLEWMALR